MRRAGLPQQRQREGRPRILRRRQETFYAPSVANAKDGSYPIVRPLYYYYMTHSEKTVKPFVDYILSLRDGKSSEIGFIPVSE